MIYKFSNLARPFVNFKKTRNQIIKFTEVKPLFFIQNNKYAKFIVKTIEMRS